MTIAPVTQVMITIQFNAFRPLNALEIARLYSGFESEFPVFDQVQAAGPMAYTLGQIEGSEAVEYEVPTIPRLSFSTADGGQLILIQNDRFSYGWVKAHSIDEAKAYPGFEHVLENFERLFEGFLASITRVADGTVHPKVAEIAYINALPERDSGNNSIRLSDIYTFLNRSDTPVAINGYNYSWNEKLGVVDGVLSVVAAGPVWLPNKVPGSSLSLTSTFKLSSGRSIREDLLAVRARSGETYRRVTVSGETA